MASLPSGVPFSPPAVSNDPSTSTLQSSFNPGGPGDTLNHHFDSPATTPHDPFCTSTPSLLSAQRLLAAYMDLFLSLKESISSLFTKEYLASTHWSKHSLFLPFNLDDNAPVVTPDVKTVPISSLIDDLGDTSFHIPLTLFT